MRAVRGPRPLDTIAWTATDHVDTPQLVVPSSPTDSGCTTLSGMCGSGAGIFLIRLAMTNIVFFVEVGLLTNRGASGRRRAGAEPRE